MAAVCRCFPGKRPGGGDRVPDPDEIENCSTWLDAEIAINRPRLVIPAGKLAIAQFIAADKLEQVVGKIHRVKRNGVDLRPGAAPASFRRLDVAAHGAWKDAARARTRADRRASGVAEAPRVEVSEES